MRMDEAATIDEGFFRRYRELLDAEDAAFDELEHAYEDGERARFEHDLARWRVVVERRHTFLERQGLTPLPAR
jgi:IS4 transposase